MLLRVKSWIRGLLLCLLGPLAAGSCEYKKPTAFPFYGAEEAVRLYGFSKAGVSGQIPLSEPGSFNYAFDPVLRISPEAALEVEYGIQPGAGATEERPLNQIILTVEGEAAWVLPSDVSFLGIAENPDRIRYVVPLNGDVEQIRLTIAPGRGAAAKVPGGVLALHSLSLVSRWYGFTQERPGNLLVRVSPWVVRDQDLPSPRFTINPPSQYQLSGTLAVYAAGGESQGIQVRAGNRQFDYTPRPGGGEDSLYIPPKALPPDPYPLSGSGKLETFTLSAAQTPSFPEHPIPLDPGMILSYPQQNWRNPRYELFQWKDFPSILIFDTADYTVQDALFKRLAFFTEKAGFRGRLVPDEEFADLHGWNAHDYRATDLAAFFEAARKTEFPLSPEERELEGILQRADIIRLSETGAWTEGVGAVISISQESTGYLRSRFMVHEGFHGLFFIDAEFRDFSFRRFEALDPTAKGFLISFFDYQHYDVQDSYLVVNEFMAHVLQQPVSHAASYFGENLAARIDASPWRRRVLPPRDEVSDSWPDLARAFQTEAEAFSRYVNQRWGLVAGRVHRVTVREWEDEG
ncbi:MAG: hypothetical protein LBQ30_03810 [Treponema sp.]|jgi:hypothetical protein|nr:hypothetical protein [Treponema sp.]